MSDTGKEELDDQAINALLRERFLRLISMLSAGYKCRMRLYENSDVECTVRGFDGTFEHVIVENLMTKYPKPIPSALVRVSDVISMNFEMDHP